MALYIMFNNFFHDLSAALWICSTILVVYLKKILLAQKAKYIDLYLKILPTLLKLSLLSLCLNIFFGVIRAISYYKYEYLPAAGRGQVLALIIKHILIFGIVLIGSIIHWSLYKEYKSIKGRSII